MFFSYPSCCCCGFCYCCSTASAWPPDLARQTSLFYAEQCVCRTKKIFAPGHYQWSHLSDKSQNHSVRVCVHCVWERFSQAIDNQTTEKFEYFGIKFMPKIDLVSAGTCGHRQPCDHNSTVVCDRPSLTRTNRLAPQKRLKKADQHAFATFVAFCFLVRTFLKKFFSNATNLVVLSQQSGGRFLAQQFSHKWVMDKKTLTV